MGTTPWEVQDLLTARLEALTVSSDYIHVSNDAWRQSKEPIVPPREPGQLAHLAFWFDDRETPAAADGFAEQPMLEDGLYVAGPITLRFLFAMRARKRREDWQNAAKAGAAALRWLNALDDAEVNLVLGATPIRRLPTADPDWLHVEVNLTALYTFSLGPEI